MFAEMKMDAGVGVPSTVAGRAAVAKGNVALHESRRGRSAAGRLNTRESDICMACGREKSREGCVCGE